jgi:hypothetical protein
MAFADPQSITISGTANSLPRIGSGPGTGDFAKDDGNVALRIQHSLGRRNRHNLKLSFKKVAADPFLSGVNQEYSMSINFTIDLPPVGFTNTEAKAVADGLIAYLSASTGARLTQLLGGEN